MTGKLRFVKPFPEHALWPSHDVVAAPSRELALYAHFEGLVAPADYLHEPTLTLRERRGDDELHAYEAYWADSDGHPIDDAGLVCIRARPGDRFGVVAWRRTVAFPEGLDWPTSERAVATCGDATAWMLPTGVIVLEVRGTRMPLRRDDGLVVESTTRDGAPCTVWLVRGPERRLLFAHEGSRIALERLLDATRRRVEHVASGAP